MHGVHKMTYEVLCANKPLWALTTPSPRQPDLCHLRLKGCFKLAFFSPNNTHAWATWCNGWMGPNMGLINGGQGLPTHPQNKIICIYIHSVTLFLGPVDKHRLVYRARMGSKGACWVGGGLEWPINRKHCCVCAATVELLYRGPAWVSGVAGGSFYFILFFLL